MHLRPKPLFRSLLYLLKWPNYPCPKIIPPPLSLIFLVPNPPVYYGFELRWRPNRVLSFLPLNPPWFSPFTRLEPETLPKGYWISYHSTQPMLVPLPFVSNTKRAVILDRRNVTLLIKPLYAKTCLTRNMLLIWRCMHTDTMMSKHNTKVLGVWFY